MVESSSLHDQQFRLSRHIRDPEHNPPPPGIEDRRLQIYRELFYNNLEDLLANNFPVIRRILDDTQWHTLIRAFLRDHRSKTPLFPEIGREFLRFLETRQQAAAGDPPWLLELAHYEWVELALEIEDVRIADLAHDPEGDLGTGIPVPSPLAWALAYVWPVHQLGPGHLPAQPPAQPTFLLVRRGSDQRVHFSQINALTFRLLQRLGEFPEQSGRQHLAALALEAGAPDAAAFTEQGLHMLSQLHSGGAILGTRPQAKE
ncbi:MAG: DUF2063 domain-containing protein [Lysobacterales bacterium CG17_big_fil_post_rev_8_21_14_2_50_64_11]|nr:MAG: DUF2063 domain-containing protein [Xanthomonadales bacterium CG17_big_fil_post_rev_8_21_14_2_50_64_11]PIX59962.1 MAG: DUF2063 domain-containing protein [Xanthomonadales bacterium CG_4_10_14_3_um_filter_64_11]